MSNNKDEEKAVAFADDLSQSSASGMSQDNLTTASAEGCTTKKDGSTPTEQMQALYTSRIVVAVFLVIVATAAGVTTFFVSTKNQKDFFESQFEDASYELLNGADYALENALLVFTTMSTTISALALSMGAQWPYYTQSDFEPFGQSFIRGSGATMASFSPIVSGEAQRRTWGNYSTSNEAWVQQGLEYQAEHDGLEMPPGPFNVPDQIYTKDVGNNLVAPEAGSGPFAPVWQMAGAPMDPSVVNYNLLSEDDFKATFDAATTGGIPTVSKVINDAAWYYGESALPKDGFNGPQLFIVAPILDTASSSSTSSSVIAVGAVVAAFSWDAYFKNVLQPETPTLNLVVDAPECGGTFTYAVTGQQVTFLGEGDKHDSDYSDIMMAGNFAEEQTAYMGCTYKLKVYPTQAFVETYQNNEPALWTLFVVAILVLTSVVFFVYDLYAQKRQFKTLTSAAKSNAIVSSLFPEEVRDRLFGKDLSGMPDKPDPTENVESSKFRLQSYLSTEDKQEKEAAAAENSSDDGKSPEDKNAMATNEMIGVDMYQTKPIADLFPNTTIMFADIAGFTAWSSVREPSQVFTLLESVYSAFDAIAKRRKVFKVETVGDCYVAVAGLPEPRADHAVVMAKFSKECLDKFNELAKQLEITLGPDTADLAMRAGLHSGPVTAGVLRGDKSRFQLFGDTVNVAARIEHTGLRNRVHLSQDTADLLSQAGKEHWVKKRAELVSGKGKGKIQTYWLHTPGQVEETEQVEETLQSKVMNKNVSLDEVEDALPPKVKRLVSWNVEILKKLLQQIVAKRTAMGNKRNYDAQLVKMEATYAKRHYLMDEVTEIISLPKFDVKHHNTKKGAGKDPLPDKVVQQLQLYVSAVAAMHRENPFHNFEHASHVTMSVSKLLARIVAPDEILNQEEDEANMAASLHDHTYGITSDPLTQFGCVLSALIHDTDHAGVSNMQLIKEKNKMANFFREKSVAEQNSIVLAWEKLMDPRFEDLRRCIYAEPSELDRFRQLVVNNVLATDIFDKELQALRKNRWDKAFQKAGEQRAAGSTGNGASADDDVNRKATVVMEHLIQASDVAHTMQHWHIYQKWNERLFAEMMSAYQAGRLGFDPVAGWYQGELGFFDNYIIPLANKLKDCGVFGVSSDEYLNYALENRREWANKGEEVVAKYKAKYLVVEEEEEAKED